MTGNTILLVDDTPNNLHLLAMMLHHEGYDVRPTNSAARALAVIAKEKPDLILLDIMMPNMDGYELCTHLQANPETADIPVIFLSSLDEVFDKVHAFKVGGVDYITKPFQVEEVLARVQTHLRLRKEIRDRQRAEAEVRQHNAELDAFAHTVAHNLKNPLTIIQGGVDLMRDWQDMDELAVNDILALFDTAARKADNIINELLLLSSVRKGEVMTEPLDMLSIIIKTEQRLKPMIEQYHGTLHYDQDWPLALGYTPWIEEVWVNYLTNGLKYGGDNPQLWLESSLQNDGFIRFGVRDQGPGLTLEEQATLFTEFTRLNVRHREGHGLGLSIAKRIAEKLGGQVGVESEVGQGSFFYFTLPIIKTTT